MDGRGRGVQVSVARTFYETPGRKDPLWRLAGDRVSCTEDRRLRLAALRASVRGACGRTDQKVIYLELPGPDHGLADRSAHHRRYRDIERFL